MAFCLECQQPIAAAANGLLLTLTCPNCGQGNGAAVFPASNEVPRSAPPPLPGDSPDEGEAVCFYSPNRRATTSCDHCGVLISEPWAAAWGNETVCLKCLEHLREEKKDERFISGRTLWDNIALMLALVPLTFFFWWAAFVTAPAALILAIRHWNSSRGLVPRGRTRLVLAILLSLLQIGGMVALFFGLWTAIANEF
jgi:hypothetical protein